MFHYFFLLQRHFTVDFSLPQYDVMFSSELVPDRVAPADVRRHLPGPPHPVVGAQVGPGVRNTGVVDAELRHRRKESVDAGSAILALLPHLLQDGAVPNDQPAVPGLPGGRVLLPLRVRRGAILGADTGGEQREGATVQGQGRALPHQLPVQFSFSKFRVVVPGSRGRTPRAGRGSFPFAHPP